MPADAFEDVEFEVTAPRVRPQSISTMGSLLLQGYAMLADSCETCGVPLMRKPNSDEVICVNCGAAEPEQPPSPPALPNGVAINGSSEDVEPAPPPLREHLAAHHTSTQSESAPEPIDTSQAIADKMLEGWALMAEHCPRCSTPLVRSREGRIYCVSCQLYAKREEEVRPGAAPAPAPAGAPAAAPARASPSTMPTPIVQATSARPSASTSPSDIATSVTEASAAVAARLAATARSLGGASPAEAAAALSEIHKCVEALQGMRTLLQD